MPRIATTIAVVIVSMITIEKAMQTSNKKIEIKINNYC